MCATSSKLEDYEITNNYKLITVPRLRKDQEELVMSFHIDLVEFNVCMLVNVDWVKTTES